MKLQNALLAAFLEQTTGAKCLTEGNFSNIPVIDNEKIRQQELVLWDFLGKDLESCLRDFEANAERISSQKLLGLFNVRPGLGIEEKSIPLGARGFFYEQDPLEWIPKGVCTMFKAELWFSRKIMTEYIVKDKRRNSFIRGGETALTFREIEILTSIAMGNTNQEVADKHCVSCHTVKTHLYNIYRKIEVPNRLQAALWAAKNL
jgi:DNA-binding CsgD family transcriptional regulator